MVAGDRDSNETDEISLTQEATGSYKISKDSDAASDEEKIARALVQNDVSTINAGKLINEAVNQGLFAFSPNLMFSQIVKNFQLAKSLYGEKLLRLITGYEPDYVQKNINIPEFQRELKIKIEETIRNLGDCSFIESDGMISDAGIMLASLVLLMEELDILASRTVGEKRGRTKTQYGNRDAVRQFKAGDKYRNLALKASLKLALRRSHQHLLKDDLKSFERTDKSGIEIIYAIDASGSMRGEKISTAKKAGIALAFKAISNKDKVGLVVFGSEVKSAEHPTRDFRRLLKALVQVRASKQTNFAGMLDKSIKLFSSEQLTKHIVILTDALPTAGKNPEADSLKAVSNAKARGISISLVGINLDKKGRTFAEQLVRLSEGRLFIVKNLQEVDRIVLEDYYAMA